MFSCRGKPCHEFSSKGSKTWHASLSSFNLVSSKTTNSWKQPLHLSHSRKHLKMFKLKKASSFPATSHDHVLRGCFNGNEAQNIHLLSDLSRDLRRLWHLQPSINWDTWPVTSVLPVVSNQKLHGSWFQWKDSEWIIHWFSRRWGLCTERSSVRQTESSGFLWARGQDHRGGQTINTQSRDVDLITAISGELRRDTERQKPSSEFATYTQTTSPVWAQLIHFQQ